MKTIPGQAVETRLTGNLLDVLLEKGALNSEEHTTARSKSSKSEKVSA